MGVISDSVSYKKEEWELIKEDILKQLEEKNLTQKHYIDLVDDYIEFWNIKNLYIEDIRDRGVNVYWDNGNGQAGLRKNYSISEALKVNSHMLRILRELNLRGADIKSAQKVVKV